MNRTRKTISAALLAAGVFLTCAFVQEGKPLPDAMKRWQDSCTPSAAHKDLERFLGSWDTETEMFGMGDAPKTKGTAEWKWLFEGRWIQMNSATELMGRPYHSQMTMGYDNFKQKYTTAGVDDLQTVLIVSEGNFDQSRQALITYGKIDEPMTGEIGKTFKSVWRFDGADKFTHEVHDLAIGETNTKVFEIVYTRHK